MLIVHPEQRVFARYLCWCCAIVLAFDAAASLIAHGLRIPYRWFTLPEWAMYFSFGHVLWRKTGATSITVTCVASAAAVEASVGWWISSVILGIPMPVYDAAALIFTWIAVTLLNTAIGIVGMWVARSAG